MVLRLHGFFAHVHQHEAAGAVGVFRHARLEAGLPERGRLLCIAHDRAAGRNLRQHGARDLQERQDFVVPVLRVQVEQHRARRIAGVRAVYGAARQLPDQPGVHRAERQFAAFGHLARARHVVQQPGQLGTRKVRVQHQAGPRLQEVGVTVAAQLITHRRGAAVLPDDRAGKRTARGAFPDQRGFALVGDADGGHVGRGRSRVAQRFARHPGRG
ncbi:hypothetical protein G6F65_019013 [Rhizopus arrhizus]|nr:hypothetical protein G6F65_019013 [Rhizopus arrhizus]